MRIAAIAVAAALAAIVGAPGLAKAGEATPSPTAGVPTPVVDDADLATLRARALLFPVPTVQWADVPDTFADVRRGGGHEALDVPAARGAAAIAVDDGVVARLFASVPGGLTVYLFDRERRFAYYYAHLDGYVAGLHEGQAVSRGDVIGYVGSSGNANPAAPHLHFAIFKLEVPPRWWRGTAIDPHPLLKPPP